MKSYKFCHLTIALISLCSMGCGTDSEPLDTNTPPPEEQAATEKILQEYVEAEREAAKVPPPTPVLVLPELDGWLRTESRSLPGEKHGFSIGFDHPSGISVTFYQFTRGLESIPNDLEHAIVNAEMQGAKYGIQQAVQIGLWQSAVLVDEGTIPLGDSSQNAIWSRHRLKTQEGQTLSDTYVWPHKNTLFKLRCTGRSENPDGEAAALRQLLTAIGRACEE